MLKPDDFLGEWTIERSIDDRHSAQVGAFQGRAMFASSGRSELIYQETGQMRLGQGPRMTATRSYRWGFEGNTVFVSFEDARPFHSFIPEGIGAGTDHPCGDDYYRVAYDFERWPVWSAVWTVVGPRKDYTSTTHYRRF